MCTNCANASVHTPTLVCFGDSICFGCRAEPGEGWVELLAAMLPQWRIVNAGRNGDTTKDALARMATDVEQHRPSTVFIQFGLNDCSWWCRQVGHPWVEQEAYIANMLELTRRAKACGAAHIIVSNNHPVHVTEHAEPGFGDAPYARMVTQYNAALRKTFFHAHNPVTFLDMEATISEYAATGQTGNQPSNNARHAWLAPDGIHLSALGNRLYAQCICNTLISHS